MNRSLEICGHHTSEPEKGCKSCSMFLDSAPACVVDGGDWYNCSAFSDPTDVDQWVDRICNLSASKGGNAVAPTVCRLPSDTRHVVESPKVVGHVYGSVDPEASALFAQRYFGAKILGNKNQAPCDGDDEK